MVHHLATFLHTHDVGADLINHGGEAQAHTDDGHGHERFHGATDGARGRQGDQGDDDDLTENTIDDIARGLPPQGAPGGPGTVVEGRGQATVAGGGPA